MRLLCAWRVVLALALGGLCQASMAAGPADHCAPGPAMQQGHGDHDRADHANPMDAKGHKSCCPAGCLPGSLVPPGLGEHAPAWRLAQLTPALPPDHAGLAPACPLRPPNRPT